MPVLGGALYEWILLRSTLTAPEVAGIPIRCIASSLRGLPFKYEPQDRRLDGGSGRRHRETVGAAGPSGVQPETGVVRRLAARAGHKRAI